MTYPPPDPRTVDRTLPPPSRRHAQNRRVTWVKTSAGYWEPKSRLRWSMVLLNLTLAASVGIGYVWLLLFILSGG